MPACDETPFLLATHTDALAAILHAPAVPVRSLLVLPPLVEERKACHRVLCELARDLAEAGTAVLRFDYHGTGDSPGDFDAYGPDAWLADAAAARAWLRARYPGLEPALLGFRFGATLATRLPSPCAARLLVEPVTGADLLKQLLQRSQVNQMVAFGKPHTTRATVEAGWRQGAPADLDGFPFTARLAADLATLVPEPWSEPGCVFSTGPDLRTADAAHAAAPASARLALRIPAFWNTVGRVDVGPLTAALAESVGRVVPEPTPAAAAQALPQPDPAGSGPVAITSPSGVIRGWLERPVTRPVARMLFIHGWSGDRTGPHRMFVKLARRLAKAGVLSLRIDLSGRGDSGGETATASIAAMTDAARSALAWLRATHPDAGPLLITAICSGCKVAISAAAAESDIAALALWSAESMGSLRSAATGRRKTWSALRTYALKLTRRETWLKLLKGRIRTDMVKKAIIHHETRSADEAANEDRILHRFRSYTGDLLFVFGGSDPDAPGSAAAYASFCTRHTLRHEVRTIAHAGHSFYSLDWEADVLACTEAFILKEFR